ncbi:TadE/TadG family type IV pilus assembly protein [Caballeronia sp. Lep1P3]|uniref:TadE/TadG family type IV pilus assembly protein n=1 Tax=Caballeronia sp. Lep1P3 TaxID=2878150 RepID=UPI001FD0359D|nr:VWA domain-containing protein [Caballeronia sp. Lep1P3]
MSKTQSRASRALFARDDGAVSMVFAVFASVMIGAMCMAYDAIHDEMAQARLQMASDVAALSAGANLAHYDMTQASDIAQWKADAYAYFGANMPGEYLQLSVPDKNLNIDVSGTPATGQVINFSVKGSIPLLAPIFLKQSAQSGGGGSSGGATDAPDTATVTASNTVLRQPKSTLELVMVLDNTGSMADSATGSRYGSTKIAGLRTAATNLVTSVFGQSNNDSYIGLVPFTTMVNLKNVLPSNGRWITPSFAYNPTNVSMAAKKNYPGSGWHGCAVEPRDAGGNLYPKAYAPKDSPGFTPWYYNVPPGGFSIVNANRSSNGNYGSSCTLTTNKVMGVPLTLQSQGYTSLCGGAADNATITDLWYQSTDSNASTSTIDQNYNINGSSTGPCEMAPALFLSKDANTLTSAISNMQANGSTLIPSGLLWGWRMLSSDWSGNVAGNSGFISTDTSLPRPETTQSLQRVVIVLTDGENDLGAASGIMPAPSFNGVSGVGDSTLRAPTVMRPDGSTLKDGSMTSLDDINAFQLGVCSAMKQSGIIVYSITFGTYGTDAASVAAQQTMQSCATPGNYYHAPTNATLDTIFQQIAGSLGVLRLTQ